MPALRTLGDGVPMCRLCQSNPVGMSATYCSICLAAGMDLEVDRRTGGRRRDDHLPDEEVKPVHIPDDYVPLAGERRHGPDRRDRSDFVGPPAPDRRVR